MASPRGAGRVSTIKLAVCGLTHASLLTNRHTGQGAGKSFLCNRFMRPNFDDLSKNGHTSVLNHSEFGSNVINNTHFLYWGEKLVGLDDGQDVHFQIIEHTEFVDDSSLNPFPSNKPYHKRCTQIKLQSGGKVTYIEPDQLALPENYKNVGRFPDKFIVDGYILCVDVSADFSVSHHGEFFERLLKNLGEAKKPIVIALTKYDRVTEAALSTVSEVISRSKRHHQLQLIEVSAEKGVNVDLCFLVLCHLVDTKKPKTRIISYADAKAHLDERIRKNEEQFQEVLDKNLADFSMRVEDASTQLSGAIEYHLLTELCGKQRVKRLIRAKLNYLRHAKVEAKQAIYLEHLPLILQTLLLDLPLDSTEKSVLELLRTQVNFAKYFLDVENWRENAAFLKRADEVVPYSLLVENSEILQKFIDTTLAPAREEAACVKIQEAIKKATGVIPGIDRQQLWEDLKVSEDVKIIPLERLARIYSDYMQVLDQECSAGLMELFLERLDLFGTVDETTDISDILSRVDRGLVDAPRYSRMERRKDIRRGQALKLIAILQMPDKSVTFGKSHLLDSLPDAFVGKQRLTPPQWLPREGDLQWVLDPKDRCFNLAILASSEENALTLRSDFMNHLSGQGVCEVGGRSYQLEIDLFHGGEIPSLTKSEFTPQGAVAVVTSMECLDWLEELLTRLFVPGEDDKSPYRGMPLVVMALDRAEDSPIHERARCLADRAQAVFVDESPTPQPKRLVVTTVIHQVLQLLIDCVTHIHGFLTNQLAVDDDGLNVAVCTLSGDPYSNESFLAPWQRHQLLSYNVTNHVLFVRTSFDKQNRICALRFFSSLNPREMSQTASIWLGYVLVYSTQRAASLSVLKALLPTLPSLPKLVVAMASEGSHDKQLLEEGRVLADNWKAMFISSSDEAFTVGYANEFLSKCWFSRFTSWSSQEMPQEIKLRLTRRRKDRALPDRPSYIQTTPLPSLPPGTRHSTALLDIDFNHPPPPSSLPPLPPVPVEGGVGGLTSPPLTLLSPSSTLPRSPLRKNYMSIDVKQEDPTYSNPLELGLGVAQKNAATLERRQKRGCNSSPTISPQTTQRHDTVSDSTSDYACVADQVKLANIHKFKTGSLKRDGQTSHDPKSPTMTPPPPPISPSSDDNETTGGDVYATVQKPVRRVNSGPRIRGYDHLSEKGGCYDHLAPSPKLPPKGIINGSPYANLDRTGSPLSSSGEYSPKLGSDSSTSSASGGYANIEKRAKTRGRKAKISPPLAPSQGDVYATVDKRSATPPLRVNQTSPLFNRRVANGRLTPNQDDGEMYATVNKPVRPVKPKKQQQRSVTPDDGEEMYATVNKPVRPVKRVKPQLQRSVTPENEGEMYATVNKPVRPVKPAKPAKPQPRAMTPDEPLYSMPERRRPPPPVKPKPSVRARTPTGEASALVKVRDALDGSPRLRSQSERHAHSPVVARQPPPVPNRDSSLPKQPFMHQRSHSDGAHILDSSEGLPDLPARHYSPSDLDLDEEAPPLPPRMYGWSDVEDNDDELFQSDDDLDDDPVSGEEGGGGRRGGTLRMTTDEHQALYNSIRRISTYSRSGIEAIYNVVNKLPTLSDSGEPGEGGEGGEGAYDTLENVIQSMNQYLPANATPSSHGNGSGGGDGKGETPVDGTQTNGATPIKSFEENRLSPRDIKLIKQQQKLLVKLQRKTTKETERRKKQESRRRKREEEEQRKRDGKKKRKGTKKEERRRYFGEPLELVVDPVEGVPVFVKKCVAFLEGGKGLTAEGLYRVSGKKDDCLALQDLFDQDCNTDLASLQYYNSSISSTLKAFFKLLPDPLISDAIAAKLLAISSLKPGEQRARFHEVLSSMSRPNLKTLAYLLRHLNTVHEHQEHNKMTASNLAIVFWPTLMRPPLIDLANPSKQLGWQLAMTRLIEHPEFLPVID